MSKLKFSPKAVRVCRQLGRQIKRSRLARKLSQELIAERSRLSLSTLKRIESGDADIRVSFDLKSRSSWSAIGRGAQKISQDKPTMNFGWTLLALDLYLLKNSLPLLKRKLLTGTNNV